MKNALRYSILSLAFALASASVTASAQQQQTGSSVSGTAGVTAPARDPSSLGIPRTNTADSTLAGGTAWLPPSNRISFCQLYPTDPACGSGGSGTPPPTSASGVLGCSAYACRTTRKWTAGGGAPTGSVTFATGDTYTASGSPGGVYGSELSFANPAQWVTTWSKAGCTGTTCTVSWTCATNFTVTATSTNTVTGATLVQTRTFQCDLTGF